MDGAVNNIGVKIIRVKARIIGTGRQPHLYAGIVCEKLRQARGQPLVDCPQRLIQPQQCFAETGFETLAVMPASIQSE